MANAMALSGLPAIARTSALAVSMSTPSLVTRPIIHRADTRVAEAQCTYTGWLAGSAMVSRKASIMAGSGFLESKGRWM